MSHLNACHDEAERPCRGDEPRRAADVAACESCSGHEHEHSRQKQKALGGFLMTVERAACDHSLDAVLLRLTGLCSHPGAQCKRRG